MPNAVKAKTPDVDYEQICENIKLLCEIAEKFSFNNLCYSVTDMLTACHFKTENEKNSVRTDENVLWSIGIEMENEFSDLQSILFKQFTKTTQKETIDAIFTTESDSIEDQYLQSKKTISHIADFFKSVIVVIRPKESHLFETVVPHVIRNPSALVIVKNNDKNYHTTRMLNPKEPSKKRKIVVDETSDKGHVKIKRTEQSQSNSHHSGWLTSTTNKDYFKNNALFEKSNWNRKEIFTLSQLVQKGMKSYSVLKSGYDKVREMCRELSLREKSDEQFKRVMTKMKA